MSSGRRTASVKRGLLAGVALLVLSWTGAAQAQTSAVQAGHPNPAKTGMGPIRPNRPVVAAASDGLKDGELYLEADLVTRNDKTKITTAEGSVEVRYEGRTLRANQLVYDEARGVMTAKGEVQILNPDGSVEFADQIVLDDAMKAGAAEGFSARMPGNIKMAGASAIRRNGEVNELNRAIYTPCDICAKDGSPKTPTWSIRADKVVQDHAHQLVYYRNAVIQIMGAPVLFLPVFWHPDPQAVRKSGFLEPRFGQSNRRGLSYEQPYLQVLSDSSDVTVSPQINTKVNPFINAHYRQRFYSGALDARVGYTHDTDFDGKGHAFGDDTSRSYVLASGSFALNDKWRWGFTAERASDDRIFDKYEVGDVYVARGPYVADDRRLISQLYATRQSEKSWFSAGAFSIQGLRTSDNDRTFPVVGPLIEARWEPNVDLLNGRLRLLGSAVALTRDQSPSNAALPGLDSRRITAEADWRSNYTLSSGIRISPFADVRADGFSIGDMSGMSSSSKTQGRGLAVAGADFTWPFARRFKTSTVVLEPVAQIAVSPKATQIVVSRSSTGVATYLDEDTLAFEFDETNLFRANKFPGYDLYEDGAR
ncbi:LPS-assembly protein LptD [Phenylobacterium aquaticum]|uniref:LPS-assembly protein LptD n=1 Tax=Phenylobacterium aquaticum TaxID=1763816 RepID=UPI003014D284